MGGSYVMIGSFFFSGSYHVVNIAGCADKPVLIGCCCGRLQGIPCREFSVGRSSGCLGHQTSYGYTAHGGITPCIHVIVLDPGKTAIHSSAGVVGIIRVHVHIQPFITTGDSQDKQQT